MHDDQGPPPERSAPRVAVDAFVKVQGEDEREYVFRTRDLSTSGLFLYTRVGHAYPFKAGTTLTLELFDYDASVSCDVVIVRVVEPGSGESDNFPTGFGVSIVKITDEDRDKLADMIARAQGGRDLY